MHEGKGYNEGCIVLNQFNKSSLVMSEGESTEVVSPDREHLLRREQNQTVGDNKSEKQTTVQGRAETLDIARELVENNNPLPLLAVLDQVDIFTETTSDGTPLFSLLMNKFLPVDLIFTDTPLHFPVDPDGRTPLHYAIEADDVKSTYWLLSKGSRNVHDKFGLTPSEQAVKLGHRRCFLLCMHYQHITDNLAHVAAEYGRVWELKVMLALGVGLDGRNGSNETPIEVAVRSYSYDAAELLAQVSRNYQIKELAKLTDSQAMVRRLAQGKSTAETTSKQILAIVQKLVNFLILFYIVYVGQAHTQTRDQLTRYLLLYALMLVITFLIPLTCSGSPASPQNLLTLLKQPHFPSSTDHICPSCVNQRDPQLHDHCSVCHSCRPRFHLHTYACIYKHNQVFWFAGEFLLMFTLYRTVGTGLQWYNSQVVGGETEGLLDDFIRAMYYCLAVKEWYWSAAALAYIYAHALKQVFVCLMMFGMAFMGRTYGQVTRTELYPHLYEVIKGQDGKLRTKEKRIFMRYKLLGGIIVGIRNIVMYFL